MPVTNFGNIFRETQKTITKAVDIFSNANDTHVMCNIDITQDELKNPVNSGEIQKRWLEQQESIKKLTEELVNRHNQKHYQAVQKTSYPKPIYPIEKEKSMLTAIRRGNYEEAKQIMNELIAAIIFISNYTDFKFAQLRVLELVVLLSRIEAAPANPEITSSYSTYQAGSSNDLSSFIIEANNIILKKVMETTSIEELTGILHIMLNRASDFIASFRGSPHAAALRKAENHISENYTRKLSLKEIASVAGLSPPYFSTIFKEEMGENLSKYLNRLRVEKASRLLLETDMSLSEIAANCCFEDQSWFSKIFKAFAGVSPGKYRNQGGGVISDIGEKNLSQVFKKNKRK